jgi:hypothetical protein
MADAQAAYEDFEKSLAAINAVVAVEDHERIARRLSRMAEGYFG